MTDFESVERLPRQRAAECLVDIAYALTGGETLELRRHGENVAVAVADDVLMVHRSASSGGHVEVTVQLSWSSPETDDPAS